MMDVCRLDEICPLNFIGLPEILVRNSTVSSNVSALSYHPFYRVFCRVKNKFHQNCRTILSRVFTVLKKYSIPLFILGLYFKIIIPESVSHIVAFNLLDTPLDLPSLWSSCPFIRNISKERYHRSPKKTQSIQGSLKETTL